MTPKSGSGAGNGKRPRPPTGEWRPAFLAALRNSANVRASCQAVGISRELAYTSRARSAEFRAQWQEAVADACDVLEAEARRRAMAVSDVLLIFLLKSHRPEVYRETTRHEVSGLGGGPVQQVVELHWDDSRLSEEARGGGGGGGGAAA